MSTYYKDVPACIRSYFYIQGRMQQDKKRLESKPDDENTKKLHQDTMNFLKKYAEFLQTRKATYQDFKLSEFYPYPKKEEKSEEKEETKMVEELQSN